MSGREGISRRGFLRSLIARREGRAGGAAADTTLRYPSTGADVERSAAGRRTIPMLRPPGAVAEPVFLSACTRCGDCATACPHDALHPAPERFRSSAGTPTYEPTRQPCLMCADLPCVSACEPAVLSRSYGVRMGTARIDPQVCLAHQGTGCSVCVEQCPVPGAIATDRGRPTIVQDACTGCGVCQHVCPAPQNAVGIMPTFVRPGIS